MTKIYKLFLSTIFILLSSCSSGSRSTAAKSLTGVADQGAGCSLQSFTNYALLTCADGSSYRIENGSNGTNGVNGANGSSCLVVQETNGVTIKCADGTNGIDGKSCSSVQTSSGAQIQCTDGTFTVISNGQDGKDSAASTGYNIVKVIDPCGTQTTFDEVLLQFANGDILGHYSDGAKQHFSLIPPGNYRTTDNTKCYFTITAEKKSDLVGCTEQK
ncbi:MAG: hypothetical protein ABL930_13630 [Pseudobdellovibrio sp.]